MAKIKPYIKSSATEKEALTIPYNVISDAPDLSVYAKLNGVNTFVGGQNIQSGANTYAVNADGFIKGSWAQFPSTGHQSGTSSKVCVLDGSGWIYYRTPAELLTDMGGAKSSDIPTKTSQLTNDSGFLTSHQSLANYVTLNGEQTVSGKKTFSAQNKFTDETTFSNTWYAPTYTDIANNVGKSSMFTRSAHMQAITGQIIAPNSAVSDDTHGYNTEVGKIKFQRITGTSSGQPTLEDMAVLSADGMTVGGKTVATAEDIPTKTSQLTNDSGFLTSHQSLSGYIRNNASGNYAYAISSVSSSANQIVALGYYTNANKNASIAIGTHAINTNCAGSIIISANYFNYGPSDAPAVRIGCGNYQSTGRGLMLGVNGTSYTYMNAAGSSWTSASDIRDKTDIEEIDHALDFISKLKPITYVMNEREKYLIKDEERNPILDENGKQQYDKEAHARGDKKKHRRFAGLSAQDTYQAMLDCYDGNTNYAQIVDNNKFDHPDDEYIEQYSMSYERLVPFLIKAVQEQQAQIDELKAEVAELKTKLA